MTHEAEETSTRTSSQSSPSASGSTMPGASSSGASSSASGASTRREKLHIATEELKAFVRVWGSPVATYRYLRRLMAERPLMGLGAAIAVGVLLRRPRARRSS
jgi:hypothetical protein